MYVLCIGGCGGGVFRVRELERECTDRQKLKEKVAVSPATCH